MLKLSPLTKRWLAMIALLIAETEVTISPNYEIRTAIRALVHIPLYHILLGCISFGVLIRILGAATLSGQATPQDRPLSKPFLVFHLIFFVLFNRGLALLWKATCELPIAQITLIWLLIMSIFLGSWLAALIPPREWWPTAKIQGPWLTASIVLGVVANIIAQGSTELWDKMAGATLYLSSQFLAIFLPDVMANADTKVMGTSTFQITIEPGCSGYQGIGLIALYTATYLWLRRKDLAFPRAFSLIPLGICINWLANSLRIACLVLVGTFISPKIAIRGFHSQAGWIAFTVISIFMILLVEKWRWFRLRTPYLPVEVAVTEYPAAAFIVPLLTLLFASMLTMAFSEGFDSLYPLRMIAIAGVLFAFRDKYRSLLAGPVNLTLAVGTGLAVYVLWIALVPSEAGPTVWESLPPEWVNVWLIFRIVGSVVIIPITEELAFRGYLLRRLQSSIFEDVPLGQITPLALGLSSLAFGLLHTQWVAGILAGLAYGWLSTRKGHLKAAMIAHGTTNLCLAVQVLVKGHWSLWS